MTTRKFRMPQKSLILYLARRYGCPWFVGFGLAIAASLACAFIFSDWRYLVVALMGISILLPMMLAFLYFSYALKPEVSFNVLPHTLTLRRDVMEIEIFPALDDDKSENAEKGLIEGPAERKEVKPIIRHLSLDRFRRYEVGFNEVIVDIAPKDGSMSNGLSAGFLYIPQSAFESPSDFTIFIRKLVQ